MASSRHHHATSTSGADAALLVFASLSLFLSRLHRSLSSTTLSTQQAAPTAAGNAARSPARGRREVNVGQPTPKESTMRQLSIAVSVMALVLVASCGVAFATHSPSAAREVVGLDTTGAQYALFLPYNWNGDLVVYAHGFFDPATPVALPDAAPVDVAPWVVELRERLLQAGYAVAYSSFSENGWAVDNGAQRTRELRPLFTHYFYKPDRTFVIGRSLGSLITMLLVEKYAVETTTTLNLLGLITISSSERVLDGPRTVRSRGRGAQADGLRRQHACPLRLLLPGGDPGGRPARPGRGLLEHEPASPGHRRGNSHKPAGGGGPGLGGSDRAAVDELPRADQLDRPGARLQCPGDRKSVV